jgi:hypothetical protein
MPFIQGRYHINPVVGRAIEAAREAEAARLALESAAQNRAVDQSDGFGYDDTEAHAEPDKGPIHRVEIEAAELVPSHSGRAQSGFIARVHRRPGGSPSGDASDAANSSGSASGSQSTAALRPETHVFTDHHDLVSFLRDEFAKDCASNHRA